MDKVLKKVIKGLFKCLQIDIKIETINNLIQFVKFAVVGVSNTIIGYFVNVVTIILVKPYEIEWDYYAGNLMAFLLGVLWSFYWNNRFVFQLKDGEKRNLFTALMKTYLSYSFTGLILNNVLSYLWIDIVHISKMTAPLINMIIGVPINFIINKLWAFKGKIDE